MEEERDSRQDFSQLEDVVLHIDPGFVHRRKIEAILGENGSAIINNEIANIPLNTPEWTKEVKIDHIYARIILDYCKILGIRTLEDCIINRNGLLMCSIEEFLPTETVYNSERAISFIKLKSDVDAVVQLEYSVNKISSDTLKSGLSNGGEFGVVAEFRKMTPSGPILHPILIGFPYLLSRRTGELLWRRYSDFYQLFVDDFDEFSKVKGIPSPNDSQPMQWIKESVFKECLRKILGDATNSDWGGETSDYFSSHVHIDGNRFSCAFLLKGPSSFRPMTLNHLGKNNDQIVRLSKEPADILVVQHSHDILPAVRETLKVFATQPSNPRHYCLMDGRDSLRLLKAYDLFDWAISESKLYNNDD